LLLGTSGAEYARATFGAEGLERAKKEVATRLGLGVGDDLGLDVGQELVDEEEAPKDGESDVKKMELDIPPPPASESVSPAPTPGAASPAPATPADEDIDMAGLSARERNVLKRKRKSEGKPGAAK
jgi:TATA-binding protein-associated factor